MPAGAVENHDDVLVGGPCGGEAAEEVAHGGGRDMRQHQGEVFTGGGLDGGEDVHPGVALVAQPWRPLAAEPPAVADAPFLAYPGLVLEPERDLLVGVRNADCRHRGGEPPFLNASAAPLSALGWAGRAFWRE